VMTAGAYVVTLDYTCTAADVGSTLELRVGERVLRGKVTEAWDPALLTDQDVVPRTTHGESLMKPFRTMTLGEIVLEPGRATLKLSAPEIPGQSVMDLRRLTITLK